MRDELALTLEMTDKRMYSTQAREQTVQSGSHSMGRQMVPHSMGRQMVQSGSHSMGRQMVQSGSHSMGRQVVQSGSHSMGRQPFIDKNSRHKSVVVV